MMILADLSLDGLGIASNQVAKICQRAFGGSGRSYMNLLRRLEKNSMITVERESNGDDASWVPRLTAAGLASTASTSPTAAWNMEWNQKWCLLTFDLPSRAGKARSQLRTWLKSLRFGKLQGSVWISPRSISAIEKGITEIQLAPESVACIEGRFWKMQSDQDRVEKAWPLGRMQAAYAEYLGFLERESKGDQSLRSYQKWRAREKTLWSAALELDPLLPSGLWPRKLRGPNLAIKAEEKRKEALENWLVHADLW